MEKKIDKRKRYRKFYEPVQNQNFMRKDFIYNNCEDYHDKSFGKFKHVNQYKYNKSREREITNYVNIFNMKSSNKREVQNISSNINNKICPWSEEAVEEERKRQVSDTANELKNKLKMWNVVNNNKLRLDENGCSEKTFKVLCEDIKTVPSQSSEHKDNELINMNNESIIQQLGQSHAQENNMDGKNFCISGQEMGHKKSRNGGILFKTNPHTSQCFSSISKNSQKKIQQSLIGDLMALPKANLQKVLVNPETHPKIEQKMAQLVKENRLILAQKFRSLAESKINQKGQFVCSKFVDDVEDLIDSDLAVDLCQLPPELITQISDIFQLDFDDSLRVSEVQENCNSDKNTSENYGAEMAFNCGENLDFNHSKSENRISQYKMKEVSDIKVEPQIVGNAECYDLLKDGVIHDWHNSPLSENFNNNFNMECIETNLSSFQSPCMVSPEEDVSAGDCFDRSEGSDMFTVSKCLPKSCETLSNHNNNCDVVDKLPYVRDECSYLANKIKLEMEETEEPNCIKKNSSDNLVEVNIFENTSGEGSVSKPEGKILNLKRDIAQQKIFNFKTSAAEKTVNDKSYNNIPGVKKNFFENENPLYKSIEIQTDINLIEADHSQPFLGQLYSEGTEKSLLREVQMIDDLLHRLNQRRFILFLKLVGLESPNLNRNNLKSSLMQAITNSDSKLMKELSLGGNKKGERKRNLKRKKNSDILKNISKKACGMKNAEDIDMINHAVGVNVQDPVHKRRKFGGKTGYWRNCDQYVSLQAMNN